MVSKLIFVFNDGCNTEDIIIDIANNALYGMDLHVFVFLNVMNVLTALMLNVLLVVDLNLNKS